MTAGEATATDSFLTYSHTVGMATMAGRGFFYPRDTAIGKDGRLYVLGRSHEAEPQGVRVTVCGLEGEFYGVFGSLGSGDGQFIWPTAIALDSQDRVYVSSEYQHRISIFDTSGTFLGKWGIRGHGDGELDGPSGLAFDGSDNLYVVDHRNNRIQKFTKEGQFLSGFGTEGSGDGEFNLPWGVAVDGKGDVYVADWRNDRIGRFSPEGKFVANYGTSGRGDGEFLRPSSVAVDREGYIYVADWGNERVQVLDPDGGFVMKLRGEATLSKWAQEFLDANPDEAIPRAKADLEPELEFAGDDPHEQSTHIEKYFWGVASVTLDGAGRLYATETNRHRVQVYQRGS